MTLIPENGFNQPIDLTCSGLPQGTTCSFNPATVTPNGAPVMSTVTMMIPTQTALAPRQAPHGVTGRNARLRLGHALGIHLVAGSGKNTKTVADRSVVVQAGGGRGIHRGIIVGFRLRVFSE